METALKIMKTIEENAKKLNTQKIRIIKNFPIGKVCRHGDVYIHRVADTHKVGDFVKRNQLADGTSMGARHILQGDYEVYEGLALPPSVQSRYPLGYAFRVHEDGAVLTHPEHAHVKFECVGLFQVTYQLDMRTLQRVAD